MEINFEQLPRFVNHSMKIWQLVPEWAHAHEVPEAAIISQLFIAHAWCNSNPKKAPKKNPVRFLHSWMNQAKRYGNLKVQAAPAPKPQDYEENYDMTFEEMQEIRRRNMPQRGTLAAEHKGAIDSDVIPNV